MKSSQTCILMYQCHWSSTSSRAATTRSLTPSKTCHWKHTTSLLTSSWMPSDTKSQDQLRKLMRAWESTMYRKCSWSSHLKTFRTLSHRTMEKYWFDLVKYFRKILDGRFREIDYTLGNRSKRPRKFHQAKWYQVAWITQLN